MNQHLLLFFVMSSFLAWHTVMPVCGLAGEPPAVHKADVAAMTQRVTALRDQGDYAKAIEAGRSAVTLSDNTFGRADPRTGAAKRALASAYLAVDDKGAAAPLVRDAIAILEQADPPDRVALSYAISDLAQATENDQEAEPLYRKAISLAEDAVGPEHSATAHALNNLGSFLYAQNRAQEAEPLMRRALHIRERTKGYVDPSTAQSLCTLGAIAWALGDISVAESLVRRSLELRRTALPKGHPDMAESCSSLAQILVGQGNERAQEAAALAAEAFEVYRKSFGPTATTTLVAMHLKADSLALLGRQAESDRLHEDLIEKCESLPGPNLELLVNAIGEFGEHMLRAKKPDKAVELYRRAIALQGKARGNDDTTVIAMRQRLADALYASRSVDEAVTEGRAVVALLEKAGGDPKPAMGVSLYSLAKYLLATGGMDEARLLLRRALSVLEKTTGRGSRETLQTIYLLAMTYVVTGELREAEVLVDDGLDRVPAQDDVRTASSAGDLIGLRAVIYRNTGRLKEAEEAEAVARQIEAEERRE